jgi:hypothetical protein
MSILFDCRGQCTTESAVRGMLGGLRGRQKLLRVPILVRGVGVESHIGDLLLGAGWHRLIDL